MIKFALTSRHFGFILVFWCSSLCNLRPKPSLGIGNRIQSPIWVLKLNFFFPKPKLFFFRFYSFFPNSWWNTSFYKLENKPSPSKIIQSYLMFGRKFGFRGPFIVEKNNSCYRELDSPFQM